MLIQYISDIHIEFYNNYKKIPKIIPNAEILVLAGDIGYPFSSLYEEFLSDMNNKFKKVFLLAGNHEYYNLGKNRDNGMEKINSRIREIISYNKLNNITFLDNSYEDYNGYRFIGCTLWSEIKDSAYLINDFQFIKHMDVELYNELYKVNYEFLEENIPNSPLPLIVITHHLPSYYLIEKKYKTNGIVNYNQCFASDCSKLFNEKIKLWIYGHTHSKNISEINNIKFICNPIGYPGENSTLSTNEIINI